MTTRRSFLTGAASVLVGSQIWSGCSSDPSRSAASTSPTIPSATDLSSTTTPSASPPGSNFSPTPERAPLSTGELSVPWAGADFAELDDFLAATAGEAFAMSEAGTLIHEWYRTDSSYARDIASAQKSMLSLLVGRAIGDGLFEIETPINDILGTAWTPHGQSAGITIRHLLSMTSGLDDQLAVIASPGTAWRYSDAFSALFDVLESVTGRRLDDVATEWLFTPAGSSSSMFYRRPTGRHAPIGLRSSVPDLLRFGELVLAGGPPGLAPGWLPDSFTASQPDNLSYGYLWWLFGGESYMLPGPDPTVLPGPIVPSAPTDMVAALGKDDQKLYLSSDLELVVARLGDSGSAKSKFARSDYDVELWTRLSTLRG